VRKAMGQRVLMDLVPLDGSVVGGSHGRVDLPEQHRPAIFGSLPSRVGESIRATAVRDVVLERLLGRNADLARPVG
jgi:hypothetical protein